MKAIDVSLTQLSVNLKNFKIIKDEEYPLCMLGVELKNEYDRQRFVFNKKLSAVSKDIVHFVHYPNTRTKIFRGLVFKPSYCINNLIDDINKHKHVYTDSTTPVVYKNMLSKYNLTCDNVITHLDEGTYPIDSECLDKISVERFSLNEIYEMLFDNKKIPFYQSVGYLSIYILDNTNIANRTNYKTLKKMIGIQKNDVVYTK